MAVTLLNVPVHGNWFFFKVMPTEYEWSVNEIGVVHDFRVFPCGNQFTGQ